MSKAMVRLLYRQVIDAGSESSFERCVWKASYEEFLLKSQAYNREGKYITFRQMVTKDGRANSLHYKCGFAVAGFIETLNKKMPGLRDSLERPVAFDTYEFKVIESDITNKEAYTIAIHYTTPLLTYYDSICNYLLLSEANDLATKDALLPAETFMLAMQNNLGIISYQVV